MVNITKWQLLLATLLAVPAIATAGRLEARTASGNAGPSSNPERALKRQRNPEPNTGLNPAAYGSQFRQNSFAPGTQLASSSSSQPQSKKSKSTLSKPRRRETFPGPPPTTGAAASASSKKAATNRRAYSLGSSSYLASPDALWPPSQHFDPSYQPPRSPESHKPSDTLTPEQMRSKASIDKFQKTREENYFSDLLESWKARDKLIAQQEAAQAQKAKVKASVPGQPAELNHHEQLIKGWETRNAEQKLAEERAALRKSQQRHR